MVLSYIFVIAYGGVCVCVCMYTCVCYSKCDEDVEMFVWECVEFHEKKGWQWMTMRVNEMLFQKWHKENENCFIFIFIKCEMLKLFALKN